MGTVIPFPTSAARWGRQRLLGLLADLRDQATHLCFDLQRALAALSLVHRQDGDVRRARSSLLIQAGRLAAVRNRLSAIEEEMQRGDLSAAAPAMMEQLPRLRRIGSDLRRLLVVAEHAACVVALEVEQEEA